MPKPSTRQLDDLADRLRQFVALEQRVTDPGRELYHEGQIAAFQVALTLIKQLKKRGSIWRGGYDDQTGSVVYSDQVQDILNEATELDKRLSYLIDND